MAYGAWAGAGWLLHHTPGGSDVGGVRGTLGEEWLIQLSVVLHTVGALLIAGALIGVIVAYRRRAAGEATAASAGWTSPARLRGLVAAGWAVNLLGGTMRLLQPDHPPLSAFNEVAWVQVLTVKHVVLLGAILASLVAVGLGPLAWRRWQPQSAAVGISLVIIAAVLGGASTTLPLPGMNDGAGGPAGLPSQPPGHLEVVYRNVTATMPQATPINPFALEVPFDVDAWTFALLARVTWATDQNVVQARLVNSEGRIAARLAPAGPGALEARVDTNLYPEGWLIVLESEQVIVSEPLTVMIRMEKGEHQERVFEETITVSASDRFLELNFWMDSRDYFRYNWSVPNAYGAVEWDIHSHPDAATVRYHTQGTDRAAEGNFTAGGDRIYSILWVVDPDAGALTVSYRVEGTFRLHSIYP